MELIANTRNIRGKKVRFLRRDGITPVHVFGHGIEPIAVQCDTVELQKVLARAGKTSIVGLKLDKAKKVRNVMVREVQKEPRTGELLHVDLYQIRMEEKLKVAVPITLVGEAPALKLKENFLSQELNTMTIECLPDRIPNHIDVDLSGLVEADQTIHVQDIVLGDGITILNHPEQLIVKISIRHIEKEVEAVPVAVAAEGEAGAAEAASEEPKKESKKETKKE
jgi:large subunit ribosomal protein L25